MIFGCFFMGSNKSGKQVSFQKQLWQAHASVSAANIKKITADPNSQQRRSEFTNHRRPWHRPTRQRSQATRVRAAQNFPPLFTIVPMKFQLLHRAVKGTSVVSLNTVTRAVHIRLLARQIHNARTLPTAAATRPAHLRHSLPARLHRSLPAAALLFSSPTAPCMTMVTRMPSLACGRMSSQQPKDGSRGFVDVVPGHEDEPAASGHEPTWIRPLRPSREQLLHSRQRLVLLEPPTPSLSSATKSAIYLCQCGLGRHALIVHL
jgi:hypothetical protein